MTYRFAISVLFSLIFSLSIAAQDSFQTPKAQLIDEFGMIPYSDIMARLDTFIYQLQNDPSSMAVIISYYNNEKAPIGKVIRNFNFMRNYMTRNRGIDPSRLNFTNGGENDAGFKIQLWYVPAGAQLPSIEKSQNDYITNTKIARKFDDAYYAFTDLEYDYWDGDSFKEFSDILKKEPNSIAYVILYPEYNKYGDENDKPVVRKDSLRKTNKVIADIRKNLRKVAIPAAKIKIVNGGYRDYRQVELWILPKGVPSPAATPNQFPKKK